MSLRKSAALALAFAFAASIAHADPYSAVVAYGDSLSDTGQLYSILSGYGIPYPPSPPYDAGRFSNGPVAVEQLAASLNAPLYDFALGGATSGIGNYVDNGTQTSLGYAGLPGMAAQIPASLPVLASLDLSSTLFVVWGGANDFLTGSGSPTVAAGNIDSMVSALQGDGAQHILVIGIPDLGLTPELAAEAALATQYSQIFNATLLANLPSGATYVDTYNLLHEIIDDPAAYGFNNVTTPCFDGTTVCADPAANLFWDGIHPTTTGDSILAAEFTAAAAPTPEPSSLLLLGSGLTGMIAVIRQRTNRRSPSA